MSASVGSGVVPAAARPSHPSLQRPLDDLAPSEVADEGGGDADEGQEVLGFAFVAAVEAAADAQPGDRSLHHPAVSAQSL
jgi:hypothetical protein